MDILETPRLILRHMEMRDLPSMLEILSDPEAMRYYPSTRDEAGTRTWIERSLERYRRDGVGLWAVDIKAEQRAFAGQCGLVWQEVEGKRDLELGYLFQRRHWGRGFATEAASACCDHAFDVVGVDRLISIIHPENVRSIRVAERVGMTRESEARWKDRPVVIYALRRADRARTSC
ncbi:GNAT family N-acetyltransferase [Sorangium sp. So ce1097]|uniref:GNAT family N-acetyltransferase n=1 Tax=Sorangium sp. So ce1097 TaxID=3133330 RepID=UPI003F6420CC